MSPAFDVLFRCCLTQVSHHWRAMQLASLVTNRYRPLSRWSWEHYARPIKGKNQHNLLQIVGTSLPIQNSKSKCIIICLLINILYFLYSQFQHRSLCEVRRFFVLFDYIINTYYLDWIWISIRNSYESFHTCSYFINRNRYETIS